ncbi:MAG: right-handed parallel beta-helix repeat-containing protein [Myxococcales bacterium]|nr:right-handed parallel beta-helix repeat-containing protein [Myxococcales bacterium]
MLVVLAAAFLTGCDDGGAFQGDGGSEAAVAAPDFAPCGPNLAAKEPACVPIFDTCSDDEVPIPGGGCKRVGVGPCEIGGQPGLEAPPDWTCRRIGAAECTSTTGAPGIQSSPDWTCTPIGAPMPCLPGWSVGQDGWCEPPAQQAPCGQYAMAVVGSSTCQSVGDCGSGRWGNVTTSTQTIYVDGAHLGAETGSATSPYRSIGAALAAAARGAGDHVVVAAGRYEENVVIDRALTLEGRCAERVEIAGTTRDAALVIRARDVTVRGVSVVSTAVGVHVERRGAVTVERVVVHDCEEAGVVADVQSSLVVRDSLVAANRHAGIDVLGATCTVQGSMVRDTRPEALRHAAGNGIAARKWGGTRPTLVVRDSVIARNRGAGVGTYAGDLVVERSVVHGTLTQQSDQRLGSGIEVRSTARGVYAIEGAPELATVTLRSVTVLDNHTAGVLALGARARLERAVVARTKANLHGYGLGLQSVSWAGQAATLTLSDVLVARNRTAGVGAESVDGQRVVVRDTQTNERSGQLGFGVAVLVPPSIASASTTPQLRLRDSTVSRNHGIGVDLEGGTAVIERVIVSETQPDAAGADGRGISVLPYLSGDTYPPQPSPSLTLRDARVQDNHFLGVAFFGSSVTIERSLVSTTRTSTSFDRRFSVGHGVNGSSVRIGRVEVAAHLTMRDSVVERSNVIGVKMFNGSTNIEASIVRDTAPASDNTLGIGIASYIGAGPARALLTLRDSKIIRNHHVGIDVRGSATIERCAIDDTRAALDPTKTVSAGIGIRTYDVRAGGRRIWPTLTVFDTRISRAPSSSTRPRRGFNASSFVMFSPRAVGGLASARRATRAARVMSRSQTAR